MNNLSRLHRACCLTFLLVILPAISGAQQRPQIAEQIAKTYGLDSWDQVTALRYTWNGQFSGVNVSRAWEWEPKTGKVSYEGKDKSGNPVKASFVLSEVSNAPANVKDEIEPAFVNDQYWLIFPLHVYWDSSATVTDEGTQKLPIGQGTAQKVVVKYPTEAGGFTPGDTWELYLGKDRRVQQFVYHRGGDKKPTLVIATWGAYKKAGPLLISTDHRGSADGKPLRVFISNLAVKLTGSDNWVVARVAP